MEPEVEAGAVIAAQWSSDLCEWMLARGAESLRHATNAQRQEYRSLTSCAAVWCHSQAFLHGSTLIQLMSAATHASADLLGATMIVTIVVAKRVVVSGLLRRAGCGIGV
jgi:hypothetical protein